MWQTILEVLSSETPPCSSHDVNVKVLAFSYFVLFLDQFSFKFSLPFLLQGPCKHWNHHFKVRVAECDDSVVFYQNL